MDLIVAITGRESVKLVKPDFGNSYFKTKVVPFVGADGQGEFAQLGVGMRLPDLDKTYFWGLVVPHMLIQSWRGMKLLEEATKIDRMRVLSACWNAGDGRDLDAAYLDQLTHSQISDSTRTSILSSNPTREVLAKAVQVFSENGVRVDDVK